MYFFILWIWYNFLIFPTNIEFFSYFFFHLFSFKIKNEFPFFFSYFFFVVLFHFYYYFFLFINLFCAKRMRRMKIYFCYENILICVFEVKTEIPQCGLKILVFEIFYSRMPYKENYLSFLDIYDHYFNYFREIFQPDSPNIPSSFKITTKNFLISFVCGRVLKYLKFSFFLIIYVCLCVDSHTSHKNFSPLNNIYLLKFFLV